MTDLLEDCLDSKCFRVTARVLQWVPVLFVMLLSGWAYYVFVYELCFSKSTAPLVLLFFHSISAP